MTVALSVRIDGLEDLRAKMGGAPPEVRRHAFRAMKDATNLLRDEVKRRIHSPGGHARRGIVGRVTTPQRGLYGLVAKATVAQMPDVATGIVRPGKGANAKAAVFSMRTRNPGRPGPSPAEARKIARRYGLPPEAAFPLARAIARRGTKGRPVMDPTLRAMRRRVEGVFADAMRELAHGLAK